MTRIVRAAIRRGHAVYSVPPPGRHHDCMTRMAVDGVQCSGEDEQGFLTDHGEFVDRKLAWEIAKRHDQILRTTGPEGTLFSEDLW